MNLNKEKSLDLHWIDTAADNAMLTRSEICSWLNLPRGEYVTELIRNDNFPMPKFGGFRGVIPALKISPTCRWRVGDIRKWLKSK